MFRYALATVKLGWWYIPIVGQRRWTMYIFPANTIHQPVLVQCWASVADGEPRLDQYWIDASCLLGCDIFKIFSGYSTIHETWNWGWPNGGPPSATLAQHKSSIVFLSFRFGTYPDILLLSTGDVGDLLCVMITAPCCEHSESKHYLLTL